MTRWLLPLVLVAVTALSASAQVNTLERDDPREEARLRLGPFYVTPRIQLTEFGIDTNVFNEQGETKSDFTFTLAPGADLWIPIARRGLLKAQFGSDLVWYRQFESERSVDPAALLRGEAYLRRITLFGEGELRRSRQRPNFEIDKRSRHVERRFTAGVDMRITPKVSLEVHGSRSSFAYDADAVFLGSSLEERLNRDTSGFGVVGRYKPSVLTTFVLSVERFADRFPLSPERGADNVRILPGVEFHPRALISGSAYVGMRRLSPVAEALLPEYSGVVSNLSLAYSLFGATTFTITYERDIEYSFEALQPYYVDTGAGLQVRRAIGPRFDVIGSAGRNSYRYADLLGAPGPAAVRVDTIWNYGGSLGYRVGRQGRIGLGATYWTRDSTTNADRRYEGLRIGTTATYGF